MIEYRHKVGDQVFFCGDTHFLHSNILKFCHRPFEDIDEMDAMLMANWNEVVGEDDVVYHLGDFAMGPSGRVREILERLNGRIRLCEGSHEQSALAKGNRGVFEAVADGYYLTFEDEGGDRLPGGIFLSHYLHKTFPHSHHGSWHLYAHSHGRLDSYAAAEGRLLDVGVDSHEYRPWTMDEVAAVMETRPPNFNSLERRELR